MQEAVPALVFGSVPAQAWSCGCTVVPMTSPAFAAAFLFFSGAPLFMLFNISISFISPVQKGRLGVIWAQDGANHLSTRCKSASMDGNGAGAGFCMSFFCGPVGSTLDDGSIGFSTRRDPSN